MKTCSCLQRRLIRSKKQRTTSLWKTIQISKLKAGSQCAGHCPSVALLRRARGFHLTRRVRVTVCQIFHPLGGWDAAEGLSGRSHGASARLGACAAHWLSGTVRDYGQGLWSLPAWQVRSGQDQGPAPGLAQAGASPWSLSHHSSSVLQAADLPTLGVTERPLLQLRTPSLWHPPLQVRC
jgi:hypothetical protein